VVDVGDDRQVADIGSGLGGHGRKGRRRLVYCSPGRRP
jgi:hypothetical protein